MKVDIPELNLSNIWLDKNKSRSLNLNNGGYADVGIAPYVEFLNKLGYDTLYSCSFMKADHEISLKAPTWGYLTIKIPNFVYPHGVSRGEVDAELIYDSEYINKLLKAGKKVQWHSEFKLSESTPVIFYKNEFLRTTEPSEEEKYDLLKEYGTERSEEYLIYIFCKLSDKIINQKWYDLIVSIFENGPN